MSFSYNTGIPAAGNAPSADQPLMLTNFGSISSIIAADHVGFNTGGGGTHKQVSLNDEASPALQANSALYSNSGNLYFKNGSQDTKMTGIAPLVAASGYTYLPGGLLLQWGTDTIPSGSNYKTVTFPTAFTAVFCVIPTLSGVYATPGPPPSGTLYAPNSDSSRGFGPTSLTVSGFTAVNYNAGMNAITPIYWMAIGTK